MDIDRRALLAATGVVAVGIVLGGCQASSPGRGARQITASVISSNGTSRLGEIRSAHGLAPLHPHPTFDAAALEQARHMAQAGRMSHSTGWGRDFATRMRRIGVEGHAAENLAHGNIDLPGVFSMWMESPGHRRNILGPHYRWFGLAQATADAERFWALVLGG